jgi:hypothetical protein
MNAKFVSVGLDTVHVSFEVAALGLFVGLALILVTLATKGR